MLYQDSSTIATVEYAVNPDMNVCWHKYSITSNQIVMLWVRFDLTVNRIITIIGVLEKGLRLGNGIYSHDSNK